MAATGAGYMGVDIGGTKVSLRAVRGSDEADGAVLWRARAHWPASPADG